MLPEIISIWLLSKVSKVRPRHALRMRPPVPETLLERVELNGTEIGGLDNLQKPSKIPRLHMFIFTMRTRAALLHPLTGLIDTSGYRPQKFDVMQTADKTNH